MTLVALFGRITVLSTFNQWWLR